MKNKRLLLGLLLLGGLGLRIYGINWDHGFHLHPDERMIIMVTERLSWPEGDQWKEVFTPQSPLNPKFFAYGSFPFYFLKFISWLFSLVLGPQVTRYHLLSYLGRMVSALFDLGTVVLVFLMGEKVLGKGVGLLAASFYATTVLPVQLSHFYAVDIMLNFFIWLSVWQLLVFYRKPTPKEAVKVGLFFGLALATKVSAVVLLVSIGMALVVDLFLLMIKFWRQARASWWRKIWLIIARGGEKRIWKGIVKKLFLLGGLIGGATGLSFFLFEPYAFFDFSTFWQQILEQRKMTSDPYVFPYTLQYVDTLPYLYQLKNMVLWGMGLGGGLISLGGCLFYFWDLIRRLKIKGDYDREAQELVIIAFALSYFLVVGSFAVKFMRYFLPVYPFLVLTGSYFLVTLLRKKKKRGLVLLSLGVFFHGAWLIGFVSIYSRPHSRFQASLWINNQIPAGKTLAVEHWDDRLPLWGGERYDFVSMPMYEPDSSPLKWNKIKENLSRADYLILASNRLYRPLMRLGDCSKFKICYPKTAEFYRRLFEGEIGFKKVAEFSSYPQFLGLVIKDEAADESFTVYDHPRVIIFKRER